MSSLHFQGIDMKWHAIIQLIQSKYRQLKSQIPKYLDEIADTQV